MTPRSARFLIPIPAYTGLGNFILMTPMVGELSVSFQTPALIYWEEILAGH